MRKIAVIGGSRYFGRRVVQRLRDEGDQVTLINRGSAPAPPGVEHLIADRDDATALRAALGGRTFDVVLDQVCGTPRQAAVAAEVFRDRTGRYLMTSTIEVYDPATSEHIRRGTAPLTEEAADPARQAVRPELPWHEEEFRNAHYGEGKRQAEAVFTRDAAFPFAAVRSAHVLGGGAADFTGRLRHYAERIRAGRPVDVHPVNHPSSFISAHEIADFLVWAAGEEFTGPVNARSHGELTVTGLCERIAAQAGREPVYRTVRSAASPYAFDRYYGMDNSRAERLGYRFGHTGDWLPEVIAEELEELMEEV
ncbi:NAD-dependent epimerase/dehydratase family protein [Streptomyces orinoci]|uniref:NAD-dependent epimerase/dehydratase family protein n=1 Tax=Streptomyces orinoci TaxID=67339 RepID=A0ABV3K6I8_STRON|nr:NAD-dependent epimerase/dehydratase family protein [Streptomyces orinoci]